MSSGKTIIILLVVLLVNGMARASLEGTVKIHVHFVVYPKVTIDKLQAEDITKPLDIKALAELLKQGKGRILASPSMVATSNVESEMTDQLDHRLGAFAVGDRQEATGEERVLFAAGEHGDERVLPVTTDRSDLPQA